MLHVAAAPAHHERHPQPKIHEQKLMEKAPVMSAAIANAAPPCASLRRGLMRAIIKQLKRRPARTRLINY